MIIIHHIGSQNGKLYSVNGTLTWFTNVDVHKNKKTGKIENKVSAHYVLPREQHKGNDLYHLVKDTNIAYHAGVSQWTINDKLRKYIN
jgi:N-acetyl-anhydromuramyl-L-alanine amidase AmpD